MEKYKFYLLILIVPFSICSSQNKTKEKTNNKVNKDYVVSRKSFYGKLNEVEYKQIRETIIKELKTKIPYNNAILINYYQQGTNCYENLIEEKDAITIMDNGIRISGRISKENNATDFFVYSSDYAYKQRVESRTNFILDSGFFSTTIFTLKENCNAFFILKPNGKFMKYYGTDYYSEVEKFLKKK